MSDFRWFFFAACRLRRLGAVLGLALAANAVHAAPPVVAAASDLQFALEKLAADFAADGGEPLRLVFGSSGNFVHQITEGAPFELFFSADEAFVRTLEKAGLTDGAGEIYGVGRLALLLPPGSDLPADPALDGLATALAEGRLSRLAIANPAHAPYGQRAEEALRQRGLWDPLSTGKHLVMGENVAQAAQFVLEGGADAGLVAWSLVRAPALAGRGRHALVPANFHAPLIQRMVLLHGAGATARAFYAYIQQPPARAVLESFGFTLPASNP
jgi:molybdate transport system substrate-binding protein